MLLLGTVRLFNIFVSTYFKRSPVVRYWVKQQGLQGKTLAAMSVSHAQKNVLLLL
jgi:hypothetical protein